MCVVLRISQAAPVKQAIIGAQGRPAKSAKGTNRFDGGFGNRLSSKGGSQPTHLSYTPACAALDSRLSAGSLCGMANSCKNCGACCTLFLVNLSRNEYASGRYQTLLQDHGVIKNFAHAQRCGAHLVAKNADDSCIYRVDNRCRIHAARPQVCRDFFCTSRAQKFAGMVEAIQAKANSK